MIAFFRSLKVGTSSIAFLIGAALLTAPLYLAVLPPEVVALVNAAVSSLLNLLLISGVVLVAFNWMFDSWKLGNQIVSAMNMLVGLAVTVVAVFLLVQHWAFAPLWDAVFGPEAAGIVALAALGLGLADRSYVRLRYILTGTPAAPADKRLAIPGAAKEVPENSAPEFEWSNKVSENGAP